MRTSIYFLKILIFVPFFFVCSFASDIDFNIDKSVVDANKTKKHVMLFLHKNNCGYCDRMSLNLSDTNTSQIIKKDFVFLDINRDDSDEFVLYQDFKGTNKNFMQALGINFYPTILFIDTNSNQIIYALSGYRDIPELHTVLDYISTQSYKRISLEEYKSELFFD